MNLQAKNPKKKKGEKDEEAYLEGNVQQSVVENLIPQTFEDLFYLERMKK